MTSSLALALGFLTLLGSAWQSISSFGWSVALAILVALIGAIVVLPAAIVLFGGFRADQRPGSRPGREIKATPL